MSANKHNLSLIVVRNFAHEHPAAVGSTTCKGFPSEHRVVFVIEMEESKSEDRKEVHERNVPPEKRGGIGQISY